MARELNISLITGIIVAILPVWQWDSKMDFLIGVFALAGITFGTILWLEEKKAKKKSPVAATTRAHERNFAYKL